MDFLADLSALKAVHPDEMTNGRPSSSQPVPRSESPLLQKLKQGEVPYAYCAWCAASLPTRSKLEEHYLSNHCDASFAPGGGRSRSGILVLLVDQRPIGQSRRQTLTALSAPEAEVVALSEALMPAIIIHESCRNIGLEVGPSPDVLFMLFSNRRAVLHRLSSKPSWERSYN